MHIFNRHRKTFSADLLAGATGAVAGAPQAMGFAIIAGVSPIYGLYAAFIAPIIGAIFSSSSFLTIGPTNAIALVIGTTLAPFNEQNPIERLFTVTLLVGLFQLAFGLLCMGNMARFVSNAVMTGFITGAGCLIILGQLYHLNGYKGDVQGVLPRFFDWLIHLPQSDPQTTFIGVVATVMIYYLHHTRFKNVATLTAIIITSLIVLIAGWEGVETVDDIAPITAGLPGLIIPDLRFAPELLSVAFAMAVLGSVQGAALTQNMPETDGRKPDVTRDFTAQGLANIVTAFFQGMTTAASLSRTAVNIAAGAKSRMANLYAGLIAGLFLILLGGLIEKITLAALAGHLVVAASSLIRLDAIRTAWRISWTARLSMSITFISAFIFPLEYSIYIGVALSLGLYIYTSSQNIEVDRLVPVGNGHFREERPPKNLPSRQPIILSVTGHLFFAAIKKLEDSLPAVADAEYPVVILRLRHNQYLGSTGLDLLRQYTRQINARHGKLILAGVSPNIHDQLEKSGELEKIGIDRIFYASDVVFQATEEALDYAEKWLREIETQPKEQTP